MAEYFQNPQDLGAWVRSRGSYDEAAQELLQIIDNEGNLSISDHEQDIIDTCKSIYEQQNVNASDILFGVLAKHDITKLNKQAESMKKEAQSTTRQRNDWSRGQRNKWNRSVDGYNANTPWRVGRDKYYDFTHYATDEVKFDEDPNHIYSGESIWRTYVMDKFYRDYKDKDGHVVGGYINDRFHVFPTAGTPANPDVPRDGGNQMALADGERTRKPRPHQYSTERRLEEARGNKLESITVAADSFGKVVKVSSAKHDEEAKQDRIYNMFKDTIEMREAGIDYEVIISEISDHYKASILGVAQIDRVAQKLVAKHKGIGYETTIKQAATMAQILENAVGSNIKITDPNGANAILSGGNQAEIFLDSGTVVVGIPNMTNVFEITDHPVNANFVGSRISFANMDFHVNTQPYIQEAADELGLNEEDIQTVQNAVETEEASAGYGQDFAVSEIQPS